ncbi:MAG: response regulator transcription factor [Bacteroidota bacterium]
MKEVLIIEDDTALADLIEIHLKDMNFEVSKTASGKTGLEQALAKPHDLIVLDLMLPDIEGLEICRQLRMEKHTTPIIMLTAKSEEIDKVLGLETGADDYITKPFSVREFTARVKAVLRRTEQTGNREQGPSAQLKYDGLHIDVENRIVQVDSHRVELTPKEFELLALLAAHPGRSYSRENLLNLIWGYQFEGYEHTVNSHINRLRSKIEPDPSSPKYILTTWGVGYRFNDSV